MSDWIEWNGGKCPVPVGTLVDVKYRDGHIVPTIAADVNVPGAARDASYAYWKHDRQFNDIVAYRVVEPADLPAQQPAVEAPAVEVSGERDPSGRDAHEPGAKLDAGKVMPWLCISGFAHALAAVADVTTKGAIKYTPNGWATVPNGEQRYMEAFGRHTLALARGEGVDADTGCLHKAQMIWNLLASLELELRAANGWDTK